MPELKFNNKIYKKEAIKKAVSIYADLAEFNFLQTKRYSKVNIKKILPSVKDNLVDEFANYVLGLTKKCL